MKLCVSEYYGLSIQRLYLYVKVKRLKTDFYCILLYYYIVYPYIAYFYTVYCYLAILCIVILYIVKLLDF